MECKHQLKTGVKGWYTCINCGKKFRGKEAKAIFLANEAEETASSVENTEKMRSFTDHKGQGVTIHTADLVYPDLVPPTHKETPVTRLSSGKTVTGKTTIIECVDCGAERVIKVQDAFQVTRCVECQKKHRNMKRRLARKNRGEEE